MICIDWGTAELRAFRLSDGGIRDRRVSARGVDAVPNGRFGDALREEIGPWLAAGEHHVLLSGAIATRAGWSAADLPCPAGAAEIAAATADIAFDWAEVKVVPALASAFATMRVAPAILGAMRESGLACLPGGRQSIWARTERGRIVSFSEHLTGEAFTAWRAVALPGRTGSPNDATAFDAGVAHSALGGGLLHHMSAAAARTWSDTAGLSFLWGILVGHEVRAALAEAPGRPLVHVIGPPERTAPHARAIEAAGGMAECLNGDSAGRGLALIGAFARWSSP